MAVAVAVTVASVAGAVAMRRSVGRGLVGDLSFGPAAASAAVAVVAGAGWAWCARHVTVPTTAALAIVTVGGMWLAVPDTEATITLGMVWLPFALLSITIHGRPTRALHPLLAAVPWLTAAMVAAWAAAWGAAARDRALPGALACFGAALVVPWVLVVARRALLPTVIVALHVAAVIAAARWAARAPSVGTGVVRSVIVLAALAAIAAAATATTRARGHPPPFDPPEHRP